MFDIPISLLILFLTAIPLDDLVSILRAIILNRNVFAHLRYIAFSRTDTLSVAAAFGEWAWVLPVDILNTAVLEFTKYDTIETRRLSVADMLHPMDLMGEEATDMHDDGLHVVPDFPVRFRIPSTRIQGFHDNDAFFVRKAAMDKHIVALAWVITHDRSFDLAVAITETLAITNDIPMTKHIMNWIWLTEYRETFVMALAHTTIKSRSFPFACEVFDQNMTIFRAFGVTVVESNDVAFIVELFRRTGNSTNSACMLVNAIWYAHTNQMLDFLQNVLTYDEISEVAMSNKFSPGYSLADVCMPFIEMNDIRVCKKGNILVAFAVQQEQLAERVGDEELRNTMIARATDVISMWI